MKTYYAISPDLDKIAHAFPTYAEARDAAKILARHAYAYTAEADADGNLTTINAYFWGYKHDTMGICTNPWEEGASIGNLSSYEIR